VSKFLLLNPRELQRSTFGRKLKLFFFLLFLPRFLLEEGSFF